MNQENGRNKTEAKLEDDDDCDTKCGLGSWHPDWLQSFATPKFFVINFSLVAILQGAYFTYLIGSMSTLEKRFAFESKVSGFILIADNLSQMIVSPIIGYIGSRWNRSRLIAIGQVIVGFSSILTAFPYFIYGPGTHFLSETKLLTNETKYELCSINNLEENCDEGKSTVLVAVVIIWIGSCLNGLGYSANSVGLPYMDDNVKKKNSPLYISILATVRLLGPSLGFLLSSICLRMYENPFYSPDIKSNDPRWIGAWWLGFLIIGFSLLLASIPLFLFPLKFANKKDKQEDLKEKETLLTTKLSKLKEVKSTLKRLVVNPILMFHSFSGVFKVLGYLGYYIFKPKYMELQYRQSASGASFFTGTTSVGIMAIGIMIGGLFIRQFKPGPKKLILWVFAVENIASLSILGAMFLGCPSPNFADLNLFEKGMDVSSLTNCTSDCYCSTRIYQPSCSSNDQITFFSPCHAGCKTIDRSTSPISFKDCGCLSENENGYLQSGNAFSGYCSTDCNNFVYYIILLSVGSTIGSTARTGNSLITLRSVDPKDKTFAMGILGAFFAVFAFIPYPLIFGAITDSACLIWEKSCGKTGNCWVYDIEKFRYYLHGASFGFILLGNLLDIGVIIYANRIKNFYDDETDDIQLENKDDH